MGYRAVLLSVALFEDKTLFQNAPAPPNTHTRGPRSPRLTSHHLSEVAVRLYSPFCREDLE